MAQNKSRILVVDDSASDLQIMVESLKPHVNLCVAKSGFRALEMAAGETPPDVVLLDVSMPELDGYETCKALKGNPKTAGIDVIFVSANDSLDEKLRGYDAGACDYLCKPVSPEELLQKVRVTLNNRQARGALTGATPAVPIDTFEALQEASEQAIIINFLRQSSQAVDVMELAELIVEASKNFGLSNILQVRLNDENINVSSSDDMSSLEKELLFRLKDSGRILQSGNRLILNFDNITQIIKDLPDDEDRVGRLRDHLMVILECATNHYKTLVHTADVRSLLGEFKQSLLTMAEMQRTQKLENVQILDNMVEEINIEFLTYELTDQQETVLLGIINQAVEAGLANFERGMKIDEDLQNLAERIMEKIIATVNEKERVEAVELF